MFIFFQGQNKNIKCFLRFLFLTFAFLSFLSFRRILTVAEDISKKRSVNDEKRSVNDEKWSINDEKTIQNNEKTTHKQWNNDL